nr:glycosyltransferase family 8 protein [uncultured Cohaesibacter sp.]
MKLDANSCKNQEISIVVSFDENYSPIGTVFLKSLLRSRTSTSKYSIYVLSDGISGESKRTIEATVSEYSQSAVHFIELRGGEFVANISGNRHITASTFFRLKLPSLFPHLDKIVYLDVDMICKADLTELMQIDLSNKYYAGCLDVNHLAGLHTGSWQENYYGNELGWSKDHIWHYKQAGVLVFNLETLRRDGLENRFQEHIGKGYWMMDQDILNICAPVNKVHELPLKWNVLTAMGTMRNKRKQLPPSLFNDYVEAFNAPSIIHYGGAVKPWNYAGPPNSLHHHFWEVAKDTIYYSYLILQCAKHSK